MPIYQSDISHYVTTNYRSSTK